MPAFLNEHRGYLEYMKSLLGFLIDFDRLMYGSDWPLVNMQNYLEFVSAIIPEKYLDKVLFDNANHIYRLGY